MKYGYTQQTQLAFDEAVQKVKDELGKEGFGILTEIDVKETLKKKLGVDFDRYIILGACNPPFAYEALEAEKEVGLMLPCNVIVYQDKEFVFISSILPTQSIGSLDNEALSGIAQQVEEKLKKAVDATVS